jgi:hypothetical protein
MTFRLQSARKLAGRISETPITQAQRGGIGKLNYPASETQRDIPQNLVLGDNTRGYRNSLPDNFLDLFVH